MIAELRTTMGNIMIDLASSGWGRRGAGRGTHPLARDDGRNRPPTPMPPYPLPVTNLIVAGGGARSPVPLGSANDVISVTMPAEVWTWTAPWVAGDPRARCARITVGDPFAPGAGSCGHT
jgi:hypothetical protein